jgi:hypothetical protein
MRKEPLFLGHARKKVVVLEKQVSGKKRLLEPRAAL